MVAQGSLANRTRTRSLHCRIQPSRHTRRPGTPPPQLLYVTIAGTAGEIRPVSIRSTRWGAKRALTPSELGAGERMRTAGLPFTRRTASCTRRSTCTDDTEHRTDGTRGAGIIWRAGPRTGPRQRRLFPLVLLLCVTPPRAHGPTSARAPREIGRALLGDQAQLSRPGDGLRAVGRTKLVQDMADMLFDGVDGNDKLPGDSLV